jgi:hypothetical protein
MPLPPLCLHPSLYKELRQTRFEGRCLPELRHHVYWRTVCAHAATWRPMRSVEMKIHARKSIVHYQADLDSFLLLVKHAYFGFLPCVEKLFFIMRTTSPRKRYLQRQVL